MRHPQPNSQLRLALAAHEGCDGYVDALLGLARDQIMARQLLNSLEPSPARHERAPRQASSAPRSNLH